MKKILFMLTLLISLGAAAQEKAFFSFCGKSGNIEMTWDQFSECKKELVSLEPNLQISSFIVSVLSNEVYADYKVIGNTFSPDALNMIVKSHADAKFNGKILIEEVMVKGTNSEGERKVPGMVIKIK